MGLKTLTLPFKYIGRGFIITIKTIINFLKYVFAGFKNFPLIIISIFSHFFQKFKIGFRKNNKKRKEKPKKEKKQKPLKSPKKVKEKPKKEKKQKPLKSPKKVKEKKESSDVLENVGKKTVSIFAILNKPIGQKKVKLKDMTPLVIDFNGEDAKKSKTKQTYEYIVKDKEGKIVKGYFDAFSKVDVHSFLVSEGNTVYSIKTSKTIQLLHGNQNKNNGKFKIKDLIFLLAQLSTYLKAGISLVDSVDILIRQFPKKNYENILRGVKYDLSTGKSFSEALERQGEAFPRLLINMIKASEMTGELPEALDDMEQYYTESEATRKAMVSAMMYPVIIFIIAIGVGSFIMLYVVPQFVEIYESMDTELPWITKFVLGLSQFLTDYIVIIGIAFIAFVLLFAYLYKKIKAFRYRVQIFTMKLPIFGNVVIYNEVTMFTKTFASLLAHNVFITDSMDILNKVTNNEVYKELITDAITNVAKGGKISTAFKDHWAFPVPAYEMIVTGERTGQLPEMMHKVSLYYQDLHKNAVARIKTFIEPAMIIMLTVMVGVIVLAIVIPMFDMYSAIQ